MTIALNGITGITTPSDVTITSSGGGNFVIQPPNSATDRTLTLPDSAGTVDTLQRAGNVLQVVKGTVPTAYDTFSSATPAASSLYVDITPSSASSKIYITASFHVDTVGANNGWTNLFRDSTNLITGSAYSNFYVNAITIRLLLGGSIIYLDSPNSTSSLRYRVYGATSGSSMQLRHDLQTPQIIAMEIAA